MRNLERAILRACTEMIDAEGAESVSVRRLVNAAGCSLRSLYNHFENLGSVFLILIDEFTADIVEYVASRMRPTVESDEELCASHELFILYFLERPNRFSFMYLHRHDAVPNQPMLFQSSGFQEMLEKSYGYLTKDRSVGVREVRQLRKSILYGMFGIMTLHSAGNLGMTEQAVLTEFRSFFFGQLRMVKPNDRKTYQRG